MAPRIDIKFIRDNADIASVFARYDIELQRDGSNPNQKKALSPFHDDSRPSLKVNLERGFQLLRLRWS